VPAVKTISNCPKGLVVMSVVPSSNVSKSKVGELTFRVLDASVTAEMRLPGLLNAKAVMKPAGLPFSSVRLVNSTVSDADVALEGLNVREPEQAPRAMARLELVGSQENGAARLNCGTPNTSRGRKSKVRLDRLPFMNISSGKDRLESKPNTMVKNAVKTGWCERDSCLSNRAVKQPLRRVYDAQLRRERDGNRFASIELYT
jgi:hypothetical protein